MNDTEKLAIAIYALETIQHYNQVHNDLEAYLYDLAEWGIGKTDTKPDPASYGLGLTSLTHE